MFKQASKSKLRFPTPVGNASLEDLWDLPLTSANGPCLNDTAKQINSDLKKSEEEDFVSTKTTTDSVLELKLSIVKEVIADKLADAEKVKNAASVKAQKEKIMEIMAGKQDDALAGKSLKALQDMLDKL